MVINIIIANWSEDLWLRYVKKREANDITFDAYAQELEHYKSSPEIILILGTLIQTGMSFISALEMYKHFEGQAFDYENSLEQHNENINKIVENTNISRNVAEYVYHLYSLVDDAIDMTISTIKNSHTKTYDDLVKALLIEKVAHFAYMNNISEAIDYLERHNWDDRLAIDELLVERYIEGINMQHVK